MKTRSSFLDASAGIAGLAFLTVFVLVFQTPNSTAQITIQGGGNSEVTIDPVNGGVADWTINGDDILNSTIGGLQWFAYETPGGTPIGIQNVGTLNTPDINISGNSTTLTTVYGNASSPFSLQAVYTLSGGPAGNQNSDLLENIDIVNNQATTLTLRFFQYANFTVPNPSALLSTQLYHGVPLFTLAQVSGPVTVSEYVDASLNPGANEGTINQPFIQSLTPLPAGLTTAPINFGLPGPAGNTNNATSSAWLVEWDLTIAAGQNAIISKDINAEVLAPVPEPTALPLVSLGLIGFGALWYYRRRPAH